MSTTTTKPGSKLDAAVTWLRDYLRGCVAEGQAVYLAARAAGHSRRGIERACAVLGIVKVRTAGTSYWERSPAEVLEESTAMYARLLEPLDGSAT
jgi:hypothetical protein